MYQGETDARPEKLEHGTFLIARDGRILWAYQGPRPFVDNKSLLYLLAEEQAKHPAAASAPTSDLTHSER